MAEEVTIEIARPEKVEPSPTPPTAATLEQWNGSVEVIGSDSKMIAIPPSLSVDLRNAISHDLVVHRDNVEDVDNVVKGKGEVEEVMTKSERRLCIFVFVLMGASAMWYWNAVLNALFSVVVTKYPDRPRLADTTTALYSTIAFLSAAGLSWYGAATPKLNYYGGVLLALMSFVFPIIVVYAHGSTGETLLYISAVLAGFAEMLFQVSGFAVAVSLPVNFAGWISFGYGICGVFTFSFWMLFSQAIFKNQNDRALWCHFSLCALVILVAVVAFHFLRNRPFVALAIAKAQERSSSSTTSTPTPTSTETHADTHTPTQSPSVSAMPKKEVALHVIQGGADTEYESEQEKEKELTHWQVFKKTWEMQCGLAFLMALSMMVYPNIAPYQWGLSVKKNDILTGMFQIGDFVGRYVPNLVPLLLLKKSWLLSLTVLRTALLVIFILIAYYAREARRAVEAGGTAKDYILLKYGLQVFLMLTLSLTHGWYASVYMCRVCEGLKSPKDRARASAMAVSLLVFAIAVGLWLAKAVNLNKMAW